MHELAVRSRQGVVEGVVRRGAVRVKPAPRYSRNAATLGASTCRPSEEAVVARVCLSVVVRTGSVSGGRGLGERGAWGMGRTARSATRRVASLGRLKEEEAAGRRPQCGQ